jgi:hypothetical protein
MLNTRFIGGIMRNTPIYRLLIGCLAAAMIAGLLAVPGDVLAEGGGSWDPPLQFTDTLKTLGDSTGRSGDSATSNGVTTTTSDIAIDALLLILTTL